MLDVKVDGIMAIFATVGFTVWLFGIALAVLSVVSFWKVYKKCNKPGWASIVPIYNVWVLFEIVGIKGWISLIPVANAIFAIIANFKLAKKFHKGTGFGLGLVFLNFIFMCILAFGDASIEEENNNTNKPNLLAADPLENGNINLMAPDPVQNNNVEIPKIEEVKEELSLEDQIEMPIASTIPEVPEEKQEEPLIMPELAKEEEEKEEIVNVFEDIKPIVNEEIIEPSSMVTPKEELESLNMEETIELPTLINNQTATKKCSRCGYENPSGAHACMKCGALLD